MWPKFLAEDMRPIMSEPHVYKFVLYYQLRLASFLLSTSFYRVRDSAPDGSSPKAIAEIFGYRLKKIDKPVPYISSHIICRFYSSLQWISPLLMTQAPESKTRWTCASWQIFSYSCYLFSFFLYASFSLIRWFLCTICAIKTQKYTLGLASLRGPLVRAYK
jgi:hypothetical protein